MEDDTIRLLRECNAGVKMGISALDELLDDVHDPHLKELMLASKETHTKLGKDTLTCLQEYGDDGKEPNPLAKMMSKAKTNLKMAADGSDNRIADLLTEGCDMGIRSLYKYLNQYKAANDDVKKLTKDIIHAEETLRMDLHDYL